ncbi:MAG: YceI family protein [Candidatus Omnitrophica bacterium]|nr:YceI family protein [Candidatus Omnitrophota bacterium]
MKLFQLIPNTMLMIFLLSSVVSAATYKIDPAHSSVGFAVKHLMISTVKGSFSDYQGTIHFDPNNLDQSKAEITIQAKSINTGVPTRDTHLRNSDFFDVEKYPTITFQSKSLQKQNDQYLIIGDLSLHGVTKEIQIPLTIQGPVASPFGTQVIALEGKTTINRQDFGVAWNKNLDQGGVMVSDDVTIEINVEAAQ